MDPNNERKVFELMVETSTRPNTPQHFLMSPKVRMVRYGVEFCVIAWYGVVLYSMVYGRV